VSYELNWTSLAHMYQSEWKNITPDQCYSLVVSIAKEDTAVILAKGSQTNY
jgi:Tfp pilus assembly protein PilF